MAQRGARATKAQTLLPVEPVDLVDDAVNVIAELGPARLQITIMGQKRLHALAQLHVGIGREAQRFQALNRAKLRIG